MHIVLVAALLASVGLEVDARTDCPSGAAVAAALQALVGNTLAPPGERVELVRDAAGVRLRLLGAQGVLAERTLPAGDCTELANAAAALIAAWRTDVGAATPRLELRALRRPHALDYEVGAGFSASLAGAAFAAGGTLALALGPRRGRVLARVALTGNDLRSLSIGTASEGHGRFTRAGVALGPMLRFRPRRFLLDLFAELTPALLYVDGVGYASTLSAFGFDVGLGGGGRAALHVGPLAPFVGARVVGWLTPQSLQVSGPSGGVTALPRFEVLLEAGIALGTY
jgi:hypothetical protein